MLFKLHVYMCALVWREVISEPIEAYKLSCPTHHRQMYFLHILQMTQTGNRQNRAVFRDLLSLHCSGLSCIPWKPPWFIASACVNRCWVSCWAARFGTRRTCRWVSQVTDVDTRRGNWSFTVLYIWSFFGYFDQMTSCSVTNQLVVSTLMTMPWCRNCPQKLKGF